MLNKILNKLIPEVHAVRSITADPLQGFNFRVSFTGAEALCFQKVEGISEEYEVIESNEGCRDYTMKFPGRKKTGELVLTRGVYGSGATTLEDVWQAFIDGQSRMTVEVSLINRNGDIARTWVLDEAWVSKWEGPSLDASSSDIILESVTIQYERFNRGTSSYTGSSGTTAVANSTKANSSGSVSVTAGKNGGTASASYSSGGFTIGGRYNF